jgi:F0F1-type ATP synthase assembly protein I
MTEHSAPESTNNVNDSQTDTSKRKPLWRRRPRWSLIGGLVIGAAFTFGYLINSIFYCSAQFSCSLSIFWLVVMAIFGTSVGALWGWLIGKFFRSIYNATSVD